MRHEEEMEKNDRNKEGGDEKDKKGKRRGLRMRVSKEKKIEKT